MSEAKYLNAVLAGRYRIIGPLGKGGMGEVLRAFDERLDREVAVKVLHEEQTEDSQARARLLREARAAAALEHAHIVRVYDVGETEDGGAYLVMELLRGHSLADASLLERMSFAKRVQVLQQLADALMYAHREGFVHRDLKPANVWIREDGSAVILDFGLARRVQSSSGEKKRNVDVSLTAAGSIVGTPAYLAPEQAFGEKLDARADQYALAVMAFELLALRLPWIAETASGMVAARLSSDAPRISQVAPWLPSELDPLFAKALSREPDGRFSSVKEFVDALARIPLPERVPGQAQQNVAETAPTELASAVPKIPTAASGAVADSVSIDKTATAVSKAAITKKKRLSFFVPLLLVVVGAVTAKKFLPSRSVSPPLVVAPLRTPGSVLACPLFEVRGAAEMRSWIAAIAAHATCAQASLWLGGLSSRTLVPAELLELPAQPTETLALHPFDGEQTRARTRSRAQERAQAWIDGEVEESSSLFRVRVRLRTRDDRVLAEASSSAPALLSAVAQSVEQLVRNPAFGGEPRVRGAVAEWYRSEDPSVISMLRWFERQSYSARSPELCAQSLRRAPAEAISLMENLCADRSLQRTTRPTAVPLDTSNAMQLAHGLLLRSEYGHEIRVAELRPEVDRLLSTARGEQRAYLQAVWARVLSESDPDEARSRSLGVLSTDPRNELAWESLLYAALEQHGSSAAVRAYAAWNPDDEELGNYLARYAATTPQERLLFQRLGFRTTGHSPTTAFVLGDALLEAGDREGARSVAAALADDDALARSVKEHLRVRVLAAEGRFDDALTRARAYFRSAELFGWRTNGDVLLASVAIELAWILGVQQAFSEEFLQRFLLSQPHRLVVSEAAVFVPIAVMCALSTPEQARNCARKIDALLLSGQFGAPAETPVGALLEGIVPYAEGRFAEAARVWQRVATTGGVVAVRTSLVLSDALDRAGQHELAAQVDAPVIERAQALAGASPAHVRAARRALAAGEPNVAATHARVALQAWSRATGSIPVLNELRTMATRSATPP